MPGFPVFHYLLEFAQTHVHRVSDAIQSSHPLSSPSPPAFNLSQHQSLFQWVSSSHQVAKVLSSWSSSWSVPVSRLRSTWQPLDQHLISHAIIIYSAARSSPQPLDLCLLSPAISAYSAMRGAPDRHLRSTVSHFISNYQSLDQHLSTILWAPVSRLISACQLLDKCPLRRLKSANAAAR